MYAIILLIVAYLIGSFPSALVIGKAFRGIDVRDYGSHNLGSTNAIRVLGKKLGFIVFFLDVLKGIITVGGARIIYELLGLKFTGNFLEFNCFEPFYYGLMAVIGHAFPIFAKFRGGKAVATSLGITLMLAPVPAILCLIVFYITLKASGYVSLSSTFAILTVVISSFIQHFLLSQYLGSLSISILIFMCAVAIFMIVKHRKNYVRIIKGTENSFKKKKNQEEKNEEQSAI